MDKTHLNQLYNNLLQEVLVELSVFVCVQSVQHIVHQYLQLRLLRLMTLVQCQQSFELLPAFQIMECDKTFIQQTKVLEVRVHSILCHAFKKKQCTTSFLLVGKDGGRCSLVEYVH